MNNGNFNNIDGKKPKMTRYQILALLGVAGGFMAGTRYQSSKQTNQQNHQAITQLTQIVGTTPAMSIQT
jgi:hypothetical protein